MIICKKRKEDKGRKERDKPIMNIEAELLKVLQKLKRKKIRPAHEKEKIFDSNIIEQYDDSVSDDVCSIKDVISCANGAEKEYDDDIDDDDKMRKYKDVYNNFENNVNYYLNENIERIIYSSVSSKNDKSFFTETDEETCIKPLDIIYHQLRYGNLQGEKLRRYENSMRYFKPLFLDEDDE
ncbi:hypothetical protein MKS88_005866 [Plasmodium brasilianum]|uniref:Uncharacterized protein n=1 Tax=Plasmodium brasilianum TaxID=5824 RepID=A0ACB9Y212_PLABR|nr:hypothetical protein MKS88_005866 [Plasmodium brasilianum]